MANIKQEWRQTGLVRVSMKRPVKGQIIVIKNTKAEWIEVHIIEVRDKEIIASDSTTGHRYARSIRSIGTTWFIQTLDEVKREYKRENHE